MKNIGKWTKRFNWTEILSMKSFLLIFLLILSIN
jgi:hypothetical protein